MTQSKIPSLKAETRDQVGTRASRRIRGEGKMPANLYGHKEGNINLAVDHDELERIIRHGSHLVEIQLDGQVERALIKDLQHDVLGHGLLHADFERVALDEKVVVAIVVDFHGTAVGSTHGGVVEYHMTEVEVECLPMDIPDSIRVEISELDIGDSLHARDIVVPENVELQEDPEEIIVSVAAPTAAPEEEVEEEEIPLTEPEVIGEKKEEEEEEEE